MDLTAGSGAGPLERAHTRPARALAAVCAVMFLTFLDTTIVAVGLADVQSTLHAGVAQLQWVVNAYALVFASLMLAAGMLGDRLGRLRILLAGVAVFAAGSVLAALAPTADVLIGGRALMGLGAAASEPATLSLIRHLYPDRRARARALGVWAGVAGLALALGPVIGGLLVGIGSWRSIFWFNLAAAAVVFVAAWVTVPESSDPVAARLDVLGTVLGAGALAAGVFAIILGEDSGYGAAPIVALFALAFVAGLAFILVEHRARAPLLDLHYLKIPGFSGALTVAFAVYFAIFAIFFFTALYLQVVVGYSGYRTAAQFLPMALGMIVASLLAGRWVAMAGPRIPMAAGAATAGIGILLTDLALVGHVDFTVLAGTLTLTGLGFGTAVVPVTSEALGVVPAKHSGMAASATNTARELGAVVGVAVLGSLLNGQLTRHLGGRLAALGVPPAFRKIVIDAVETGGVPGGPGGASAYARAYGPLVVKVINAAYAAFHNGLSIALLVAGAVMLTSAVVASLTLRTEAETPEPGPEAAAPVHP